METRSPGQTLRWENIFSELEQLVVLGQHDECRSRLDSISPREIPREHASHFSQLASRLHHSLYALKVLYRFIFPENSFDPPASDQEKMIYAYALLNLGATDESLELLNSVNSEQEPEVLFHRSLAYMSQWNYAKTIPLLKQFIASKQISPYRGLVGEVNLAAAHICSNDFEAALPLLAKIQDSCRAGGYHLLLGNSFELLAQVHFFQKQFAKGIESLDQASEILKNQKGLYLFFVEKWRCLCQCFQANSTDGLAQMREKAMEDGHWDTVREADLFEAILKQDENLALKVIMGTPSDSYRQRVRDLFGVSLRPRGEYELYLHASGEDSGKIFDPYAETQKGVRLSDLPQLLNLFEALTVDFYKPSYLGALFKRVYPDEKFNPSTSPPRLLRLLNRLDQWFKKNEPTIFIHFKKSEFAIRSNQPIRILIRRGKKLSLSDIKWNSLRTAFDGRNFSALKISEELNISKTSAQRMIKEALEAGRIGVVGRGRSTEYRFVSNQKVKQAS